MNMFGLPPANGYGVLGDTLVNRSKVKTGSMFDRLNHLLDHTQALVAAGFDTGRWRVGHPDPEVFHPGDVPVVAALSVLPQLRAAQRRIAVAVKAVSDGADPVDRVNDLQFTQGDVAVSELVLRAARHHLDAFTAHQIMGSHPPERAWLDEMHLPFDEVAIIFGADMPLPEGLPIIPDDQRKFTTDLRYRNEQVPTAYPVRNATILEDLDRFGGYLAGVVLFSGAGGVGLADEVVYLVATNPDESLPYPLNQDRIRGVIMGYRSRALLASAVENLAATVAFADWQTPVGPDLPDEPRQRRRALRHNRFRRAEQQGAYGNVRVIAPRPVGSSTRSEGAGSRGSPRAHLRRGHWRRARVGPGRTETRLVRIAPTVVNADATSSVNQVWKVPKPAWMEEPAPTSTPATDAS